MKKIRFSLVVVALLVVGRAMTAPGPSDAAGAVSYRVYLPVVMYAYPAPPQPELNAFPSVSRWHLGEAMHMTFVGKNAVQVVSGNPAAGRAYDNALVVAFPALTQVQDASQITVVSSDFVTVTKVMAGGYWRVVAETPEWDAGAVYSLTLDVQPVQTGAFDVLAKVVMHTQDTAGMPYVDPWSGQTVTEADVRLVSPPATGSWSVDTDGEQSSLLSFSVDLSDMWNRIASYRAAAGVPALEQDTTYTSDCYAHDVYMVLRDVVTHDEDPNDSMYTPGGHAAGQAGALVGFAYDGEFRDIWAADALMATPFTVLQVLNPWLRWSGAGVVTDTLGSVMQAGCVDIARGVDYLATPQYPVMWPPDGGVTPVLAYRGGAYPDPLAPCGYQTPTGAPIVFSLGEGSLTPVVSSSSLTSNGTAVPYCLYTEATYTSPDAAEQQAGRDILTAFDAVVLVPQTPLQPGMTYQASITVNGRTYAIRFMADVAYSSYPAGVVR